MKVIATSREGLRVGAEQLWPVPSLDVKAGATSAAVVLFVQGPEAVKPGFSLDTEDDATVVTEICIRLDGHRAGHRTRRGARMVSMNPTEVLRSIERPVPVAERLASRLGTSPDTAPCRAVVLRTARPTMNASCCSTHRCSPTVSTSPPSPKCARTWTSSRCWTCWTHWSANHWRVTTRQAGGQTRYGLLETIRQFAEDQLAATGTITDVRDRHARYYATQVVAQWDIWDGPHQRTAVEWVDTEFTNLRSGFRWATDQHDLDTATAIAAHTTLIGTHILQRYEPVGWAEELVPVAHRRRYRTAPAASRRCGSLRVLRDDPRTRSGTPRPQRRWKRSPVPAVRNGRSLFMEANAHLFAGRVERSLEIFTELTHRSGLAHVQGLIGLVGGFGLIARFNEAEAIADEALTAARAHGNPNIIAYALSAYGRVFVETDPLRALDIYRQGLTYTRQHRLRFFEAGFALGSADLETIHGNLGDGLMLFDFAIDSYHQAGSVSSLWGVFPFLVVLFDRSRRPECRGGPSRCRRTTPKHQLVVTRPSTRSSTMYERFSATRNSTACVATGAAMESR